MTDTITLPDISFADTSPAEIEANIITVYESLAGRALAAGDPVRLFLQAISSIIIQQRFLIDFTGKMNLLQYSAGEYLENIGAFLNVTRLPAEAAQALLEFTVTAGNPNPIIIPEGTRATPDGETHFATLETLTIAPGQTTGSVLAACTTDGAAANGYEIGAIDEIVDPFPWFAAVENTTASGGGAEEESDDAFRERIRTAPTSFSVAGPVDAYKYWARTASAAIIDVAVLSPNPGEIVIYPLMTDGELPTEDDLTAVEAICSADTVRPFCDDVSAEAPTQVDYDIELTYYIAQSDAVNATAIQAAVTAAIADFQSWQRAALGRDINPSVLIQRIIDAGAKRVELTEPAYAAVSADEVAAEDTVTVTYGGLEAG
jgi:phage-related baseplate assembly protein